VAALPASGTAEFTVTDHGKGAQPAGSVTTGREGQDLVVGNGLLAVRLPAERKTTFEKAVAAATLPAPILGFRNRGKHWLGKGTILSQRKVSSLTVEVVEKGPVLVEMRYHLTWSEGGSYTARIQVIDQVPLVKVVEEFDMKVLDGTHFWELDLARGWKPDRVQTASHHGNGAGDPNGRIVGFKALMKGQKVQYLVGDQAWGKLSHLGLFTAANLKEKPDSFPLVGMVPLRKGLWRKSNAIEVRSKGAGDLRLRFPMGARHAQWMRDITSETSPFSTLEHDPALSKTFGRRVWGLALGQPAIPGKKPGHAVRQLHRLYGVIGLDRYKDFILDWPAGKVTHPRIYSGKRMTVSADRKKLLTDLTRLCGLYFTTTSVSHHGTCAHYNIAAHADAVLADSSLPMELRREIRARIALLTYLYEDGDVMSYGNGHHHGNPNMGTARFWSGPTFLALIPDHPMHGRWLAHMAEYGRYNMSSQIAPGGGYFEFGVAYHMHGFARATNGFPALVAMGSPVAAGMGPYLVSDWRYYMNLLTPFDSRWQSRVIPGMANSPAGNTEHFLEGAGAVVEHDRALAANLLWAHKANGARGGVNQAIVPAGVAEKRPALTSQVYPGIGVIFRAHQGPEETWMLFRAGFQWSHWTPQDPGEMLLMSRGAVLLPYQPYQYGNSGDAGMDTNNTIRFGHAENIWPHGWGDCNMIAHAFGPTVDYAWAATGFPEWYIDPGVSPSWQNSPGVTAAGQRKLDAKYKQSQGAFVWNRQILFMKGRTASSPNYFVIRDSMPGKGRLSSYFNLDLLGTSKDLTTRGNVLEVKTEWPVGMDVTFAGDRGLQPKTVEQRFRFALHNANLADRVKVGGEASPNWVDRKGAPFAKRPSTQMHERHTLTRLEKGPGEGYYWVIFPRTASEPAPRIRRIGEDVVEVKHREGTDWVCLTPTPKEIRAGKAFFNASAAAVRLGGGQITLMTGGAGTVGYGRTMLKGTGAVERSWPSRKLPAGTVDAGAQPSIAEPPLRDGEEEVAPGVRTLVQGGHVQRLRIRSDRTVTHAAGAIRAQGRNAVIEMTKAGVRFLVPDSSYAELSVGNRGIRGVGPFDLTFAEGGMEGTVRGVTRSFACTWPTGLTRPMFTMDGQRYNMGWADDHSVGKGETTPEFSVGFGVTAGEHRVRISEWTYPALPPQPERRILQF
jgi:hypothetical protein